MDYPSRDALVPQITTSPDRRITKSTIAVVVAYAVLTLVQTHPAWRVAADHQLSCCNDTWLFIWTIGWDVHALTHAPWAIFDANIFYPRENTLAYSEHLIGSVLVAAPVVWITGNQLLATNLVAISSVFLCAIGGYVLGRRLGFSETGAFVCGLVFAFTPPRFARIYQLHLTTIQWIPFALAFLHGYFQSGRARDLRLAAAFFSLQALTSGHGAAMLTLGGALVIAHHFATGGSLALSRRIRDIGVPGLLLIAPVGLILIPYWRARSEVGLVRALDDMGVTASSWLSSPSHAHTFFVSLLPDWTWLQTPPDAHLFPGVLPLLLAAAAFLIPAHRTGRTDDGGGRWWARAAMALDILALSQIVLGIAVVITGGVRLRAGDSVILRAHGWEPWIYAALLIAARAALARRVRFAPWAFLARTGGRIQSMGIRGLYLLMLLVTVWMTIGPPFGVWPWVYRMPGLSFIRVPSRFMLLGMLALGVIAAIGFERIAARLRPGRRLAATSVLAVLLAAEFASMPLDMRPYPIVAQPMHQWLSTQPKPFSLVELPVPRTDLKAIVARRNSIYMQYSMAHFQPLVQGYSGIEPPGYPELEQKLMYFPDEASLEALAGLRVTYAVVHMDSYHDEGRTQIEAALERFEREGWLRLVFMNGDKGRVYTIHRP